MSEENRARILVVEDEQIVALDLRGRLNRLGYDVPATAATGAAAIAKAIALRAELVLMDVKLSGPMDGITAATRIREALDVPIVYLTAFGDEATLARAKATEIHGYVLKPFEERELQIAIEVALFRRRMERRLEQSEAWLAATIGSVADGVLAIDGDGRVRLMNAVAEAMTGFAAADARGREVGEILRLGAAEVASAPPWVAVPHRVLTAKDGSRRPVGAQSAALRDAKGNPIGVVWVLRDVSEPLRLLESQRVMLEASADLWAAIDDPAALGRVARRLLPALGDVCTVHLAGPDGQLVAEVVACVEERCQGAICDAIHAAPVSGVAQVVRAGERVVRDLSTPEALGEALGIARSPALAALGACSLVSVPLPARGRVLGVLTFVARGRRYEARDLDIAQDIGWRMAMAIDNARLYRDAQRAIRQREEALAIVSHDLRSPLAGVLGSADLIRQRPDATEPIRAKAEAVRRSAERMERLIADLLDAARLDDGSLALQRAPSAPRELVAEALESFEIQAAQRNVALSSDVRCEDPVLCDRARIHQVLANLLGNALKFTPPGGVARVQVELLDGAVCFSVVDSGPGVPPEQVPHLFDRYWQAAPEAARQGVGLGLHIVRSLVELHGGHIWVESAPGRGTVFSFTLPRAAAGAAAA